MCHIFIEPSYELWRHFYIIQGSALEVLSIKWGVNRNLISCTYTYLHRHFHFQVEDNRWRGII